MNYEYTGRHLDVTPALRSHVENHFDKIKHLFDGNVTKTHIIIEVEKGRHRAEIIVNMRDRVLTANSTVSDMYQALTQAIDKVEKQALKLKSKVKDKHQKRPKNAGAMPPVVEEEIIPPADSVRIIDVTNYPVKPMTAEEAALRIDGEENQFVVFRDAESEKISVLYKRKDGHYGLIQP